MKQYTYFLKGWNIEKTSFPPLRNNSIIEQNHCFVYHLCSATGSGSNKSDWCVITGLIALPPSALSGGFLHREHWKVNVNGAEQHHLEAGNSLPSLPELQDLPLCPKLLVCDLPKTPEIIVDEGQHCNKRWQFWKLQNHSFPTQINLVPENIFSLKTWNQRIILIYFPFSFSISHFQ